MKRILPFLFVLLASGTVFAQSEEYVLTIKNHTFSPKEIKIPAGKKVKLMVVNDDPTPAEFESKSLGREKIIPPKSRVTVNVGPLKVGRYAFFEEFHENEAGAHGAVVAE